MLSRLFTCDSHQCILACDCSPIRIGMTLPTSMNVVDHQCLSACVDADQCVLKCVNALMSVLAYMVAHQHVLFLISRYL